MNKETAFCWRYPTTAYTLNFMIRLPRQAHVSKQLLIRMIRTKNMRKKDCSSSCCKDRSLFSTQTEAESCNLVCDLFHKHLHRINMKLKHNAHHSLHVTAPNHPQNNYSRPLAVSNYPTQSKLPFYAQPGGISILIARKHSTKKPFCISPKVLQSVTALACSLAYPGINYNCICTHLTIS